MAHNDPETQREYHKRWYQANKERMKAKAKAHYRANREKALARNKRYLYGVTPEQHAAMIEAQGNRCAICAYEPAPDGRPLVIDHCHRSNRVRQLLCDKCNTGLGQFRDNAEFLAAAVAYVNRHDVSLH